MPANNDTIGNYFDLESARLLEQHKDVKSLRAYLKLLRTHLDRLLQSRSEDGEEKLNTPVDLFELCREVDLALEELSKKYPALAEMEGIISSIRAKVASGIIESMFEEKVQSLGYGAVSEHRQLTSERDLAKEMLGFLVAIKDEDPETCINPSWIRINHPEKYASIVKLIKDPATGILDWHRVRDMLPRDVAERSYFVRDRFDSADKRLVDQITHYRNIAECLGPEFLADFLMVSEPSIAKNFRHALKIISRYLGRTTTRVPTPSDIADLPAIALEKPALRKVVFLNLRNYVYQQLASDKDEDLSATEHKRRLREVKEHLLKLLNPSQKEHLALIEDVIEYFDQALSLPVSDRMRRAIKDEKTGEKSPVPSLRQRVAMVELEKEKILLLAFFMGKGKTAASFLCKEHVGAKKMLYICTNGVDMPKTVASQVDKHYRKDGAPSVGIITSECSQDEIDEAVKAEIIIMPYSVLTAKKRESGMIAEQLYEAGIDFLTVDEVQWAKKEKGLFTEEVRNFTQKIPGLENILLLSGDPVPNSPNDILPQLRLKKPDEFIPTRLQKREGAEAQAYETKKMQGLRYWMKRNDPLLLRTFLLDFVLNLDPPGDWEKYVEEVPLQLSPGQQAHYDTVLENGDLTTTQKIYQLTLALLNPALGSPTATENATLDKCFELVVEDLQEHDSVVIAQDPFRHGIVDRMKEEDLAHIPSFMEQLGARLEAHFGPGKVIMHGIHGGVPIPDREDILREVKEPPEGKKVVLCSVLHPIKEGINLSQVSRAILLYPTMRKADTAQFVKRFARDGNEDARLRVLTCPDTIFQGINDHATHKYYLSQRLLHGGTLTDEDLAVLEGKDISEKASMQNGRLVIGNPLSRAAMNDRQTMNRYHDFFQNKGEAKLEHFVDSYGQDYAERYVRNWEGTYSANNGRFVAGLLDQLVEQGDIPSGEFADLACGPLVLENTYGLMNPPARIVNFDINPYVMEEGVGLLRKRKHQPAYTPTRKVSRMTQLDVRDGAFSFVNCATALQCLGQTKERVYKTSERAMALIEMNRVLVDQGVALITLSPNSCTEEEFEAFKLEMQNFGFEVMPNYTGHGISTDDDDGRVFHNYVVAMKKVGLPWSEKIQTQNLRFTRRRVVSANTGKVREARTEVWSSHHNEFEVNENTLKYKALSGEKLAKVDEIEYQRLVNAARTKLLDMHSENGGSLDILSDEQEQVLAGEGIKPVRIAGVKGDGKWQFCLLNQEFKSGVNHQLFEDIAC
jgi:hypothetical protein